MITGIQPLWDTHPPLEVMVIYMSLFQWLATKPQSWNVVLHDIQFDTTFHFEVRTPVIWKTPSLTTSCWQTACQHQFATVMIGLPRPGIIYPAKLCQFLSLPLSRFFFLDNLPYITRFAHNHVVISNDNASAWWCERDQRQLADWYALSAEPSLEPESQADPCRLHMPMPGKPSTIIFFIIIGKYLYLDFTCSSSFPILSSYIDIVLIVLVCLTFLNNDTATVVFTSPCSVAVFAY